MKTCRLKIITANIIDDTDIPRIQYISQNKRTNEKFNELIDELSNVEQKENKENINNPNNNKIDEIEQFTKNDIDNNNNIQDYNINSIDNNNIEKVDNNINDIDINNNNIDNNDIMDNNNYIENEENNNIIEDRKEYNNIEENKGNSEENKIDINDLCTRSNQYEYEDDKSNIINNNYDTLKSHQNNNYISNYPYNIEHKKKELKTSIRYLFKSRETKPNLNKGYSSVYDYKNKSKRVKNIIISKTLKYKKNNISKANMNKSSNGLNINKSFCFNNYKNKKYKSNSQSVKNKSNRQSIKNISFKSNKSKNKSKNKNKYSLIKKNKTSKNKLNYTLNDTQISSVSWNIIEKSDFNIDQTIDYTFLLDDLANKECELIREKEKIIEDYEAKLKPIRELNNKLMSENDVEIDREDELKGELVVLRNHYERIFSQLNLNKNSSYFNLDNYIENNKSQEEFKR